MERFVMLPRRWIVPDLKFPGHLKLMVAEPRPADAICEAPHNFTNEMEPYFEIYQESGAQGSEPIIKVKFNPSYLTDMLGKRLKKKDDVVPHVSAAEHIKVAKEVRNITVAQIHNSLNPIQRFIYGILGPSAHSPRPFMKLIFGDKLLGNGFVAGGEFDV